MRKVYIVSTKFIGEEQFFNPDTKTNETITCAKGCTDLYKRESDDIVVYGFNSKTADYPSNVEQLLDDLRQQLTREDDEVFFILHDKTLGLIKPNYSYADNIIGFQHICSDYIWLYLRDFKGTVQEFSQGADYLFRGSKLDTELQKKLDSNIYELAPDDSLMNDLHYFALEGSHCRTLQKKLLQIILNHIVNNG